MAQIMLTKSMLGEQKQIGNYGFHTLKAKKRDVQLLALKVLNELLTF